MRPDEIIAELDRILQYIDAQWPLEARNRTVALRAKLLPAPEPERPNQDMAGHNTDGISGR